MYRNKKIAVVIPARNEEKLIQKTLERMPDFVDGVYVVDDGSRDGQNKIVLDYSQKDSRVNLIKHDKNYGVGAAIISGYKQSSKDNYDISVVVGGDNQMPLEEMERFLDPLVDNIADYSKGNRFLLSQLDDTIIKMPKIRLIGNWLVTIITKIASGYYKIFDFVNGYTAITKDAIDKINWSKAWKGYGYPMDFLIRFNAYSLRVVDVPHTAIYDIGVKQTQIKGLKYFFHVSPMLLSGFIWRLRFKYLYRDFHPLFLFYWLSFILIPLGLVFGFYLVFNALSGGDAVTGPRAILCALLLLSGLQFLFFAMFFDMEESKN